MREDLKKVLCEDARFRSDDHYHNYRHLRVFKQDAKSLDADNDEPFHGTIGGSAAREPIKKRYDWNWNRKEFGEHLAVLEGIVRKNLGRPWDKVFSEICKIAGDRSSTLGAHIFQHLFDYIETKTYTEEGEIYFIANRRWGGGKHEHISHSGCEFFVHPKTGCITRNKNFSKASYATERAQRAKERKEEELKIKRVISSELELHKFDDVWFEIKFVNRKPVIEYYDAYSNFRYGYSKEGKDHTIRKERHVYPILFDVLLGMGTDRPRVAISKRTLSHKELKAYAVI